MNQSLILLVLRLGSALLLLVFLGLIFWFLFQELRLASRMSAGGPFAKLGTLQIMKSEANAPAAHRSFDLAPVTSIGRNRRNTIILEDTFVSGDHALLTWRDTQWWLEDLGSRNGTLLNGVPLSAAVVLSAGDLITIGSVMFRLELPGTAAMVGEGDGSGIRDSNP